MKPEVRQAITWASKVHPTLGMINSAASRVERYKKRAEDENAGEQAALAVRNLAIVVGVAATVAAGITYVFSKEPSEPPKETQVVAASVCESYEQSVENLFAEAIGRVGMKSLFPSADNRLSFGEGRSNFMMNTDANLSTGMTSIIFDAEMRGAANESSMTGKFVLINANPELQQQKPDIARWVSDEATHLAGVAIKGKDIEGPEGQGVYSANGGMITFSYDSEACRISADPHGLKGEGGLGNPSVPEAARLEVAILRHRIAENLPPGPAFS